jgi:glycosyltransferase involved in cell wall biosynthesis
VSSTLGTVDGSDFDVVFLFAVPWNSYRQRSRHLASELSRRHRVLYVEQVNRTNRVKLPKLVKVTAQLIVLSFPYSLHPNHRSILKTLEVNLISAMLRTILKLLEFRKPVVIHCDYYSGGYVKRLGQVLDVYDCLDEHAAFSWSHSTTAEMEDDLTRRCDVVLAVSERLVRARQPLCPNTFLVPNAAELDHFSLVPNRQKEIEWRILIPHPLIGFIGSLYDWVDFDLLSHLARKHPDWSIVLIGPARTSLKALQGLPNVYLLGQISYPELPSYLQAFDVALIPFKVGPLTLSADVIKVYEYLAAGKPIVATNIPSTKRFRGVVSIAADFESFDTAIQEALMNDSPARVAARKRAVLTHSWKVRAEAIENILASAVSTFDRE